MAAKRILVIPHIGSAYGHLIRTAALLENEYSDCEVIVSVPESALSVAKRHMPMRVGFATYPLRPTVTNPSGRLDTDGFLALVNADRQIAINMSPHLVVGDPGIRAGLVGERLGIPWVALTHGCYLPIPRALQGESCAEGTRELAAMAWSCATSALDHLVTLGSGTGITSWADLRNRGEILIPNTRDAEPCETGTHVGLLNPSYGFSKHEPVRCLLTLCSAGDVEPDQTALRAIVALWGRVSVIGVDSGPPISGVEYLGYGVATNSLIGKETVVITHGGHGTLKAARDAALIVAVPSDLDQLCNSLIASAHTGVRLAIGESWRKRLLSGSPFKRYVDWRALVQFLEAENPVLQNVAVGCMNATPVSVS